MALINLAFHIEIPSKHNVPNAASVVVIGILMQRVANSPGDVQINEVR